MIMEPMVLSLIAVMCAWESIENAMALLHLGKLILFY
jgi:hypothetical protein